MSVATKHPDNDMISTPYPRASKYTPQHLVQRRALREASWMRDAGAVPALRINPRSPALKRAKQGCVNNIALK